ncbi:MAG: TonB-dependent receptor, partial [Deltaproteobacteria bacterium]|nr:TonB-dependent receptor [Deltaproteobacteria bacterium]
VVTATRGEKAVQDAPGAVTVVTNEEIKKMPTQSIYKVLQAVPGYSNHRQGSEFSAAHGSSSVRGISGNRTQFMIDGLSLHDPRTNEGFFDGIAVEDLEQIEVVKGAVSALYGSGMAGVINLIPRMPEKREFRVKAGYGSGFDRESAPADVFSRYLAYGDKIGRVSFLLSFKKSQTNGYSNQFRTLSNSTTNAPLARQGEHIETVNNVGETIFILGDTGDMEMSNSSLNARIRFDITEDTVLKLGFFKNERKVDYGPPHDLHGDLILDLDRDGRNISPYHYPTRQERDIYSGSIETRFGDLYTKLSLGFYDLVDFESFTPSSRSTYLGGSGYVIDTDSKSYFVDWQFSMPVLARHLLTWGLSYKLDKAKLTNWNQTNWRDLSTIIGPGGRSGGDSANWAFYVQDEIDLMDDLTLYLGGRIEQWKLSGAYTKYSATTELLHYPGKKKVSFSPKVAAVYRPFDDTAFRISGGKGFTTPSLYQLLVTANHSGGVYLANPRLNPETMWSWDASVTQRLWTGAEVSLGYFENYMKDLISASSSGTTATGNLMARETVAKARSRGLEFQFSQEVGSYWRFGADYAYTDSKILSDRNTDPSKNTKGKRLQYVPQHLLNLRAEGELGPVDFYLAGRYMSERKNDAAKQVTRKHHSGNLDPFFTLDGKVSFRITDNLTSSVSVTNILDRDYFDGVYKAPGASWFFEMAYEY